MHWISMPIPNILHLLHIIIMMLWRILNLFCSQFDPYAYTSCIIMFIDGKSEIDLHVFCGRDFSCNQINFLRRLSNKKGTMKIPYVNRRSSSKAQLKYDHISLRSQLNRLISKDWIISEKNWKCTPKIAAKLSIGNQILSPLGKLFYQSIGLYLNRNRYKISRWHCHISCKFVLNKAFRTTITEQTTPTTMLCII